MTLKEIGVRIQQDLAEMLSVNSLQIISAATNGYSLSQDPHLPLAAVLFISIFLFAAEFQVRPIVSATIQAKHSNRTAFLVAGVVIMSIGFVCSIWPVFNNTEYLAVRSMPTILATFATSLGSLIQLYSQGAVDGYKLSLEQAVTERGIQLEDKSKLVDIRLKEVGLLSSTNVQKSEQTGQTNGQTVVSTDNLVRLSESVQGEFGIKDVMEIVQGRTSAYSLIKLGLDMNKIEQTGRGKYRMVQVK